MPLRSSLRRTVLGIGKGAMLAEFFKVRFYAVEIIRWKGLGLEKQQNNGEFAEQSN